jgi:hypothetical protein
LFSTGVVSRLVAVRIDSSTRLVSRTFEQAGSGMGESLPHPNEERFTLKKRDSRFSADAIGYYLN